MPSAGSSRRVASSHRFRADRVPPRREAGAREGLQEHPVEGEGQQLGVAQAACQRLRLACGRPRALRVGPRGIGGAALDGDRGEQPDPQPGGRLRAESGERARGGRDDGAAWAGSSARLQIAGTS